MTTIEISLLTDNDIPLLSNNAQVFPVIPPRHLAWDYDAQEVREYEREGECNGCGDCCRGTIRLQTAGNLHASETTPDNPYHAGGDTTSGVGLWAEVQTSNGVRHFWRTVDASAEGKACPALLDDNRCRLQLEGSKPVLCAVWPMIPQDIVSFPRCSYTFKEIARTPFAEVPLAEGAPAAPTPIAIAPRFTPRGELARWRLVAADPNATLADIANAFKDILISDAIALPSEESIIVGND